MAFKLAIDAGHWINEPGRRNLKKYDAKETREWTMNDRVARHLAEAAKQYEGVSVLRTDDVTGKKDVSLAERSNSANKWGADFFISVHHNGGVGGGSGGGVVVFSYPGSANGVKYRDNIYNEVITAGGIKGNRSLPKTTANFAVLRQTKAPAVLIECGFMDSSTDVPIICKDEYSKKVAAGIMAGIAKTAGLKKKKESSTDKSFTDVDSSAWYAREVKYVVEKGLMDGKGNGKFLPNSTITRAEVAAVVARLHKALSK